MDKLDQVLAELRDIRTLLEGLMQPLVTIAHPNDHERWTAPVKPFGADGVQQHDGSVVYPGVNAPRNQPVDDDPTGDTHG